LSKLNRRKTVNLNKQKGIERELIDKDRTFFCSELVAKAFKVLGIIEDNDIACSQVMPHHFSAIGDKVLKLTPGTKFEEELQVIVKDKPAE